MIGVGVIGYGYWGPNLVRNFSEAESAQLVAVSDFDHRKLAAVRGRYPAVKTTSDYRDLISDNSIDALVIATPVSSHYQLALEALQAGKHVLVEKPMTATVEEGVRLIDEAERKGLTLMVDHTFVYTGAVRKIKDIIDSGHLGPAFYYDSVRVNLGLFQRDVNVIWDLAVHDLSIMDFVLGVQPSAVSAIGMMNIGERESIAYLTCLFDEGLIAHFHVNWLAPVKIRRTLIGGSNKMIVYDDLEPSEKVKVYDKGITVDNGSNGRYDALVGYRLGDMWAPQLDASEALRTEALHFIDCIENKQKPITGGIVGLRVVHILETATKSLIGRGQPIELCWDGVGA